MTNNNFTKSSYTRTYTSYSGADIKATFGNLVIGELQSITYSVTREKAPVFTLGDANPRSFSRGKRGIAGSLTFTVFDRDALKNVKDGSTVYRHGYNSGANFDGANVQSPDMDAFQDYNQEDPNISRWQKNTTPHYSDEIPPFDVTISFMNEYGHASSMTIYAVEITNEGMGLSIDDITTEKACTFVARGLSDMGVEEYSQYHEDKKSTSTTGSTSANPIQ